MKTKPIGHLKKGETLVLTAWDGSEHRVPVQAIEHDNNSVRVIIPPTMGVGVDGKPIQISPSAVYVEDERVNVGYETKR